MVIIRHLFSSLCLVTTDKGRKIGGGRRQEWEMDEQMFDPYLGRLGLLLCRIDLAFMRPGKDEPTATQSGGKAMDRYGVMFCSPSEFLKVGHRIKCLEGPIQGIFDIRGIDQVLGYSSVSHMECSVVEVASMVAHRVATPIVDPPRYTDK